MGEMVCVKWDCMEVIGMNLQSLSVRLEKDAPSGVRGIENPARS